MFESGQQQLISKSTAQDIFADFCWKKAQN